jgi:hypothetical protein
VQVPKVDLQHHTQAYIDTHTQLKQEMWKLTYKWLTLERGLFYITGLERQLAIIYMSKIERMHFRTVISGYISQISPRKRICGRPIFTVRRGLSGCEVTRQVPSSQGQ